jgi:hypothetical protein
MSVYSLSFSVVAWASSGASSDSAAMDVIAAALPSGVVVVAAVAGTGVVAVATTTAGEAALPHGAVAAPPFALRLCTRSNQPRLAPAYKCSCVCRGNFHATVVNSCRVPLRNVPFSSTIVLSADALIYEECFCLDRLSCLVLTRSREKRVNKDNACVREREQAFQICMVPVFVLTHPFAQ